MNRLLVTARTVYADYAAAPLADAAVLVDVDTDTVLAVDVASAFPEDDPANAIARLDLGGLTIGPGLIDAHVHLAFDGSDDPVAFVKATSDDDLVEHMLAKAGQFTAAGITTVRDLGSRHLLAARVQQQLPLGSPHLVSAHRPLTTPDGHCWYFGGECRTTEDMCALVEEHAVAGATWIKLVVSGGFLTDGTVPATAQFDVSSLTRTVTRAHQLGLRVAAHAHSTVAIDGAVRAGVDTVEHATFLAGAGVDFDPQVRARLLDSDVTVCPTANSETSTYPATSGSSALERLAGLHAEGLPLVVGTDAGVRHVQPSDYVAGLLALERAGMGRRDILVAATSVAAQVLGVRGGRLAPGHSADLVGFVTDPLTDPTTIATPRFVMAGGHLATPAPTEVIA